MTLCVEELVNRLDRRLTVIGRLLDMTASDLSDYADAEDFTSGLGELIGDTREHLVEPLLALPANVMSIEPQQRDRSEEG
jgi:hypothetical protein